MLVQQILKSKSFPGVMTIGSDMTVADAARFLSEKRVGAVVISDDGHTPLGILSERDIVRELGRRGESCMKDKVTELMTSKLVTCTVQDSSDKILAQMTDGRFRHLPVMNDEGRMIGLISIGDAVKARLSELAMEKESLEGMIKGF